MKIITFNLFSCYTICLIFNALNIDLFASARPLFREYIALIIQPLTRVVQTCNTIQYIYNTIQYTTKYTMQYIQHSTIHLASCVTLHSPSNEREFQVMWNTRGLFVNSLYCINIIQQVRDCLSLRLSGCLYYLSRT